MFIQPHTALRLIQRQKSYIWVCRPLLTKFPVSKAKQRTKLSRMEALGAVASGISIGSLAIHIAESLTKVIRFCKSIKEAPADIQRLLTELQILSYIVSRIHQLCDSNPVREDHQTAIDLCLCLIRDETNILSSLCQVLVRRLSSAKRITRTWARVKTVLSENEIAGLQEHLERAKSALQLLQHLHIL